MVITKRFNISIKCRVEILEGGMDADMNFNCSSKKKKNEQTFQDKMIERK